MSSPSGFAEVDPFTQQSSPTSSRADDQDIAERRSDDHSPSPPAAELPSPPVAAAHAASTPAEPSASRAETSSSQPSYSRAYNLQQAEYAQASIARYLQGDTFTIEVRPFCRTEGGRPQSTDALPPFPDRLQIIDAYKTQEGSSSVYIVYVVRTGVSRLLCCRSGKSRLACRLPEEGGRSAADRAGPPRPRPTEG